MLSAYHRVQLAELGCEVWALNPGPCLINLTGERMQGAKQRSELRLFKLIRPPVKTNHSTPRETVLCTLIFLFS